LNAAQDLGRVAGQADDGPGAHHRRPVGTVDQGAAAGGDHQPLPGAQLGAQRRFHLAEGRLAVLGKDARDRLAGAGLDLGVHVDELAAQPPGGLAAGGGLAGAHKTGEDEVR
jgi:hypothetical protein